MREGSASPCVCGATRLVTMVKFTARPEGEPDYGHFPSGTYRRSLLRCPRCGHFQNRFRSRMTSLYDGAYNQAAYQDQDGMRRRFEQVVSLPPRLSDNWGRTQAVVSFLKHGVGVDSPAGVRLMDVGSGLCIFGHAARQAGFSVVVCDPDPTAVTHAVKVAGVDGIAGDFMDLPESETAFVLTLNRVLEHVRDSTALLAKAACHLEPGGFIYAELPDGEAAWAAGPQREEFFIDHPHIFSPASAAIVSSRAGLHLVRLERLREPSGKFTIRLFMQPKAPEAS